MYGITRIILSMLTLQFGFGDRKASTTCTTECLDQAKVPCEIVTKKEECPRHPTHSGAEFPGLPESVSVDYYIEQEIPRLNVTWVAPGKGLHSLKGFELKYYRYVDNPDPFANRGPEGLFGFCVQYNMTRDIYPQAKSHFHHDCVYPTQHYFQLASLPYQSESKDYVHRVIATFRQASGYPGEWQPPLVVIHNDSCGHTVEVEVTLAPKSYGFKNYLIALRSGDSRKLEDYDNAQFSVEPGEIKHNILFRNVKNGVYVIKVYPEPDDQWSLCTCPYCGEGGCVSSKTGAFIINDQHPKCASEPVIDSNVDHSTHLPVSIPIGIFFAIFSIALLALLVAIFLRLWKTNKKHTSELIDDSCALSIGSEEFPDGINIARPGSVCSVDTSMLRDFGSVGDTSELQLEARQNESECISPSILPTGRGNRDIHRNGRAY